MKKGYKRIILFNIILSIILLINSFIFNAFVDYFMPIFLMILIIIYKLIFGFEKDKHRYVKDIILEIAIFLIIFFVIYYIFGLVIGFAKTKGYLTIYGFKKFIIPTTLNLTLIEIYRYMTMTKSEGNVYACSTSVITLILLTITSSLAVQNNASKYEIFLYIALTFLPAVSKNVTLSIMEFKTGYKPLIFYSLIMGLYQYIFPIVPNPNEYITSIILFILPILMGLRIYLFFQKEQRSREKLYRKSNKKRFGSLVIPVLITFVLVYFTSGAFKLWAIAIASGSMTPNINKGDVVIIEKINKDYDKLEIGQVIAFKNDGLIIVHRLIRVVEVEGKYYFYTKGDANGDEDHIALTPDMIVGKVNYRIPFIGIPTVWLNEL